MLYCAKIMKTSIQDPNAVYFSNNQKHSDDPSRLVASIKAFKFSSQKQRDKSERNSQKYGVKRFTHLHTTQAVRSPSTQWAESRYTVQTERMNKTVLADLSSADVCVEMSLCMLSISISLFVPSRLFFSKNTAKRLAAFQGSVGERCHLTCF